MNIENLIPQEVISALTPHQASQNHVNVISSTIIYLILFSFIGELEINDFELTDSEKDQDEEATPSVGQSDMLRLKEVL